MSLADNQMLKLVRNDIIFTSVFPIICCEIYLLSSAETKNTHSTIFSNIYTKQGEEGISRILSKRKQDELTPTILVEQTSTSTLVGEEDNETTHSSNFFFKTLLCRTEFYLKF